MAEKQPLGGESDGGGKVRRGFILGLREKKEILYGCVLPSRVFAGLALRLAVSLPPIYARSSTYRATSQRLNPSFSFRLSFCRQMYLRPVLQGYYEWEMSILGL